MSARDLVEALRDADPAVRLDAARTLVHQGLTRHGLDHAAHVVAEQPGEPAVEGTLFDAAPHWEVPAELLTRLLPALLSSVEHAAVGPSALYALEDAAKRGVWSPAVTERLASLIASSPKQAMLAGRVLWQAANAGLPIAAAEPALTRALKSRDPKVAYFTGAALARLALRANDGSRIADLLAHDEASVREGAAVSLAGAAGAGADVSVAVAALAAAVGDPAGGVAHRALAALKDAAAAGTDLGLAVPDLSAALDESGWSKEGWVFGIDLIGASDLAVESPAEDAAATLALHHVHHRDLPSLEVLLADKRPVVVRGARLGLDQAWITDAEFARAVRTLTGQATKR